VRQGQGAAGRQKEEEKVRRNKEEDKKYPIH
jgi:hypothetical protein